MSINMDASIRRRLISTESYFRRACEQVYVLNGQIHETKRRFNEADDRQNKVSRYNLRLRLSVLEGVRNMFYEFAAKKAAEIVELQRHVLAADDMILPTDDSDSEVSELAYSIGYASDTSGVPDDSDDLELC